MIFAALKEAAEKGELILIDDGLCRWHRRRDGVVVIREILVLPWKWRTGIGRRMLGEVVTRNPGAEILAKCPVSYEANCFWRDMGFTLGATKDGINEWRLSPSSGAPMETSNTPAPPSPPAGCTE